jgi:iron-sulfur cluster repair protein YtfE (RIC family)
MEKAEQLTDILKRHHQREEDVLFPELEKRHVRAADGDARGT